MSKTTDSKECPRFIPTPKNTAIHGSMRNNQTGLFFHPNGFIIQSPYLPSRPDLVIVLGSLKYKSTQIYIKLFYYTSSFCAALFSSQMFFAVSLTFHAFGHDDSAISWCKRKYPSEKKPPKK